LERVEMTRGICADPIKELERRRKLGAAHKGKIVSEETRQKMSEAIKGKIISEEHRQKLSETHKGKIISKETREKMREAHKKRMGPDHKGDPRKKSTCTTITEHHETMKDDPEHLSTDFIQKLIGKDCKI
jgi:hypothetical protein